MYQIKNKVMSVIRRKVHLVLAVVLLQLLFAPMALAFTTQNCVTYMTGVGGVVPIAGSVKWIAYPYNPTGDEKVFTEAWNGTYTPAGSVGVVNVQLNNLAERATLPNGTPYMIHIVYPSANQWGQPTATMSANNVEYANTFPGAGSTIGNPFALVTTNYVSEPQTASGASGNGKIILSWTAPATGTATGYRVYRTPAATEGPAEIIYDRRGIPSNLLFEDTATNGTTYKYIICAYNATGFGPHTNEITITPSASGIPTFTPAPATGAPSSTVVLTGTNFGASGTVYMLDNSGNRIAATVNGAWSATSLNITVPALARVGSNTIYVFNDAGAYGSAAFTVSGAAIPLFSAISPISGAQGATVVATVDGLNTNFLFGTTGVTFEGTGVAAVVNSVQSATRLTMTITINGAATASGRIVYVTTGTEKIASGANAFTVTLAGNVAPNAPTTLVQYRTDGTTVIANGAWTNENSVILSFSMSDTNNPDTLTPVVEIKTNPTAFDGTGLLTGTSVGVTGSPVTGSYTATGLADSTAGYNWRARVQDSSAATSTWLDYNVTKPNFRVDTIVPVVSATVPNNGATGVAKATSSVQVTFTDAGSLVNTATVIAANISIIGSISGAHAIGVITGSGNGPYTINFTGALTDESVTVTLATPAIRDNATNALSAIGNSWTFAAGTGTIGPSIVVDFRTHGRQIAAYPNPFNPKDAANPLTMPIGANTGEAVSIYILDTNGRVIWKHSEALNATRLIRWDGQTSYGEDVENGLYILRAVKGSEIISKGRILVIKK